LIIYFCFHSSLDLFGISNKLILNSIYKDVLQITLPEIEEVLIDLAVFVVGFE